MYAFELYKLSRSILTMIEWRRIATKGNVAPFLDTYRTMCLAPPPEFRRVLEEVREMGLAD
jgi:hypothetical protein